MRYLRALLVMAGVAGLVLAFGGSGQEGNAVVKLRAEILVI